MDTALIDRIHLQWNRVFHALKKHSKSVLQQLNITKVDANILLALQTQQHISKQQLANKLIFKSNSLTRSLDRLIQQQLIERHSANHDRRLIQLSLSPKGKKCAYQYLQLMRPFWQQALCNIDADESKALAESLNKIALNTTTEDPL